jgi:hypothetical protein
MAEIQAGTIFAAIAPNTDVDRRSALVNERTLSYTIEDIAAAVGSDVDLSAYLTIEDAEDTYQTQADMTTDVNDIIYNATRYSGAVQVLTSNIPTGTTVGLSAILDNARQGTRRIQLQAGAASIQAGGQLSLYIESDVITESSVILCSVSSSNYNERFLAFPNQCGIGYANLIITAYALVIAANQYIDINYVII